MTCRHGPDDIECSGHPDHQCYQALLPKAPKVTWEKPVVTPDKKLFKIIDIVPINATWNSSGLIVLEVSYPNCSSCSFEGTKILVVTAKLADIHTWSEIDPHFSDKPRRSGCCPSPIARFPANKKAMAVTFAKSYNDESYKGVR